MRKIAVIVIGCVALVSTNIVAQVVLPFADGFDYPEGERLGGTQSGVIWNVGNSIGTGSAEIRETATLTYPGLLPLGGRGVLSSGVPTSNRDRGVSIGSPAGALTNWADLGVLYVSYLLRIDAGPTGHPRLLSAYRDSSGTAGGFTPSGSVFVEPDLRLGIGKGTNAVVWTSPLTTGTTHLIVLKYQYVEGLANDIMSLWLNPPESALGVPEAQVPAPTISTIAGSDDAAISTIQFPLRTSGALNGGGTYAIDEFRLGTTWADVTPLIPEPSAIVLSVLGGLGLLLLRLRRKV